MRMRKLRRTAAGALFLGLLVCSYAVILGYWKLSGSTGNILTMGSFENRIQEEYQVPSHVDPGQKVDKRVNVANTGTVDSLIRLSVKKVFGKTGEDGIFQEEPDLDPEVLQITCNTKYWKQMRDGYYYYTEILKAKETTKEPLFEEYTLSEEAGNEYKGKEGRIIVTLESVQAQADAEELWGVPLGELGITRPGTFEEEERAVRYLGQRGGFQVTESGTDLFASFKNLTPGCARTQMIALENASGEEVEFYLRAEETGQKTMTAKERELVKQLMEQYAVIEITGDSGKLYRGPVSGNLQGKGSSMKQDIFLGRFSAKEIRRLKVSLKLSEKMDNRFCSLTGKVKWIFTAKGEDSGQTVQTTIPTTADRTEVGMWIALLVDSGICFGIVWLIERRRKRREEREIDQRNS